MDINNSKTALARSWGVSRQSLYYQPKQTIKDEELKEGILKAQANHPAYGYRRIALTLKINHKRASRVMRKYGLGPKITRRKTRKSRVTAESVIPNRLKEISLNSPDQVWVGDFTYLWYMGRYLYLATVMDMFTREVVGWQVGFHHTASLVTDTLKESLRKRKKTPKLFHSDQGSEYAGHTCINWLIRHKITSSHSPKGKPWVNGRQEAFFSSFKLEFGKASTSASLEDLIERIGRYIHYYNTGRIHSSLKCPPKEFYDHFINKPTPT